MDSIGDPVTTNGVRSLLPYRLGTYKGNHDTQSDLPDVQGRIIFLTVRPGQFPAHILAARQPTASHHWVAVICRNRQSKVRNVWVQVSADRCDPC